jgi:hypothetical protein
VFQQLQQQLASQGIANQEQANSQARSALIEFGGVPTLSGSQLSLVGPNYNGYSNPEVRQLADQNTAAGTSTQARLTQAHDDAVRQLKNALAARGLLHSGETGFELNRENQAYTQANYDATQQLVDYLAGVQSALSQAQQQQAAQLAQAAQAAYANQLALAQNQQASAPSGGSGAPSSGGGGAPPPPAPPPPAAPPAYVPPPATPTQYYYGPARTGLIQS